MTFWYARTKCNDQCRALGSDEKRELRVLIHQKMRQADSNEQEAIVILVE